jgi:hypothetical protein
MSQVTNYIPHWCMMDQNNDKEWGCGWRSLQMLLSQLSILKDVWTLGFEVKEFTGDPELVLDYDKGEISMCDLSQTAPYFVNEAIKVGAKNVDFDMLMINNNEALKTVSGKLDQYFNSGDHPKTLALFGTGGNVACIGGFQKMGEVDMIYLIDPHGDSPEMDFDKCNGIGRGGQGWVSLKETVMYGNHIFNKSEDDFLGFNPALIVLFHNISVVDEN